MDLQKIVILCVVALIIIGGWFVLSRSSETSGINEGALPTTDQLGVPAPGHEGVEEMVVVSQDEPASEVHVFTVTGKNFEFSTTEIHVNAGDTVTINFESTDGFHDWVIDAFDAKTDRVQTGGKTSVTFVADASGTYEYYCSVGSHRELGMTGTLIVE